MNIYLINKELLFIKMRENNRYDSENQNLFEEEFRELEENKEIIEENEKKMKMLMIHYC